MVSALIQLPTPFRTRSARSGVHNTSAEDLAAHAQCSCVAATPQRNWADLRSDTKTKGPDGIAKLRRLIDEALKDPSSATIKRHRSEVKNKRRVPVERVL